MARVPDLRRPGLCHVRSVPLCTVFSNNVQFETPLYLPSNLTVCTTPLSVFFCSSDSMAHVWTASDGETWIYMGKVYKVSQGRGLAV